MSKLPPDEIEIPLGRVSKFVRQITHDVRNGLSAVDLEAAFISELTTDPEALEELRKLRGMVTSSANMLKELSQAFQPVVLHLIPWSVSTFYDELKQRTPSVFPNESGESDILFAPLDLGAEVEINIDLDQAIRAFFMILKNGVQFRDEGVDLTISGAIVGDEFVLELKEPKSGFESIAPPEQWGQDPLFTTRSGGYGLGLWQVRRCMDEHHGALQIAQDDEVLYTRMRFPLYHGQEAAQVQPQP